MPCALIANFPAVKKLTNDVSHVVATLRICENVQVTLDGTMVRPLFVPFVPMVPTPGPSMHGAGPAVVPGTRSSVPGGARYDGAGPRGGGGRSGGAVYVIVSEGIPKDTPADVSICSYNEGSSSLSVHTQLSWVQFVIGLWVRDFLERRSSCSTALAHTVGSVCIKPLSFLALFCEKRARALLVAFDFINVLCFRMRTRRHGVYIQWMLVW